MSDVMATQDTDTAKRAKHWADQDPEPTQQELIARAYLRKVDALGKAAADRMGRAYGTRDIDWDKLVKLWNEPAPDVDEAQVWDQELDKAVQALADDESLDRDEVLAELPIVVADIVYPQRRELVKSGGGTTYQEWTDFADQIEERAAKVRPPRPPVVIKPSPPPPLEPPLLPQPLPPPLPDPMAAGGMVRPSIVPPIPPMAMPMQPTALPVAPAAPVAPLMQQAG